MVSEIQLHRILKKAFTEEEAERIIEEVKHITDEKFENKKELFATKDDIARLTKQIYATSLIQILTIVGSVLGILKIVGIL